MTVCATLALSDTPDLFMLCCAVAFTQGLPLPALIVDLQAINGDGAPMLTLHHQSAVQVQRTNINFGVVDAKHGITVQMDLLRRRKSGLQTQDVGQRKPVSSVVASEELDSIISNVGNHRVQYKWHTSWAHHIMLDAGPTLPSQ